jgi:murein L,D-transpeptidase YafK
MILIHGGCSSIGCFAMTNPVSDEIHQLTLAAMDAGEQIVPVHIYPFRMTDAHMAERSESPWKAYWTNLKEGYDLFERSKRPPIISVCGGRYIFREAQAREDAGPLQACGPTLMAIREQDQWLSDVPYPTPELPKIATHASSTPRPIPQMQSSLEIPRPVPTFSWPLVR